MGRVCEKSARKCGNGFDGHWVPSLSYRCGTFLAPLAISRTSSTSGAHVRILPQAHEISSCQRSGFNPSFSFALYTLNKKEEQGVGRGR